MYYICVQFFLFFLFFFYHQNRHSIYLFSQYLSSGQWKHTSGEFCSDIRIRYHSGTIHIKACSWLGMDNAARHRRPSAAAPPVHHTDLFRPTPPPFLPPFFPPFLCPSVPPFLCLSVPLFSRYSAPPFPPLPFPSFWALSSPLLILRCCPCRRYFSVGIDCVLVIPGFFTGFILNTAVTSLAV